MSNPDTSKCPDPPRNCQKRTWDHSKSLADWDPTHSPSGFPSNSRQSTWSSMCHSWNWQNRTPFPTVDSPLAPVTIDRDLEFKVSEILDSKLDCCSRLGERLRYLVQWLGYEGTD